jgi:peptidoglycan/xylan/chitin deacetylase (PgdA/CDA1 family)
MYVIKSPWLLRRLYPSLTWSIPSHDKTVYLTFDDGPHPEITSGVLANLKEYNAKATFFCIGKNVVNHQETYRQVLDGGHAIGNHTYDHLNGWKTADDVYMNNIVKATEIIDSKLFRPPYGRISRFQVQQLKSIFKIVMWDVLSADFDTNISPRQCLENVIKFTGPGSIIVFHDSEKAFPRLKYALPKALEYLSEKGFSFKSLS